MPRGRPHKTVLVVFSQDRAQLLRWSKRSKSSHGLAQRASIILRCADGDPSSKVARDLRITNPTCGSGGRRFIDRGLAGLLDEPGWARHAALATSKLKRW
jgi:hypothetical protein